MPTHSPGHYPPKEKMLRGVIWHPIFEDLSQSEKLSEIKPPLTGSNSCQNQDAIPIFFFKRSSPNHCSLQKVYEQLVNVFEKGSPVYLIGFDI